MDKNDKNDKNNYMDEITMKLLTNKTNYAKYLLKTDTCKYEEQQQFIHDCSTFKDLILDMTRKMCDNDEVEYGSDVTHMFDTYARTLIRYLEVKQQSDELQQVYNNDDEDVMFPESINLVDTKSKLQYSSTLNYFISNKK
jgi:hypothetical protein